jgi:hypothetical protein
MFRECEKTREQAEDIILLDLGKVVVDVGERKKKVCSGKAGAKVYNAFGVRSTFRRAPSRITGTHQLGKGDLEPKSMSPNFATGN